MRYVSTRGGAPELDFGDVLLAGLASDGGLYLPRAWPRLTPEMLAGFQGRAYAEVAAAVMQPFVAGSIPAGEFAALVAAAYAGFDQAAVAPLRQLDASLWLLELFHGPTLAFKDFALQVLGRLLDRELGRRGLAVTVVGATSGDTGSAAIAACRDRPNMQVFILHPKGRVSEVQRRQMTTVTSKNVHNLAIEGSFDDCQALVKGMFADANFRERQRLAAVNSINWARVMAQIVYYVTAAVALGAPHRPVGFAVPTGNFGNVFAGYAARRMGLPIDRLIVATNANDILVRFLATGRYQPEGVVPTLSPSMDIQVASNFERLLFECHGRDAAAVARLMGELAAKGEFQVSANALAEARGLFGGHRVDDRDVLETIARVARTSGVTVDPHTACGIAAARAAAGAPTVVLGTAHPAKFPEAVRRALGRDIPLPPAMADLMGLPERVHGLPNDLATVQAFIRERAEIR
ncbi:MAG: threonine synthase [Alphaproteobacteria bacterium]|nr:threonine synthase [Alphaproteobacteria bacterium]